jgi:integrase
MRQCDVDTTAKTVRVTDRDAFKPKREASYRSVPVSAELCSKLAALAVKPQERLFTTDAKAPYQFWLHRFQAAQRAAGLSGKLTFHDLRRAVADRLRRGNVPLDAYCTYMGHAAITGLRHYATVDEGDLRKAHAAAMAGGRRRT